MFKNMENLKKDIQFILDLYKTGDFVKAEQVAKKILINNSKVGFIYNLLGLILTKQNKIDEAADYYQKGINADPNFAMLYNNLGLIHKSKKNYIRKFVNEDFPCNSAQVDVSIYSFAILNIPTYNS